MRRECPVDRHCVGCFGPKTADQDQAVAKISQGARCGALFSETIELAPDQKVISTGPYALMRHPVYAGGIFMILGIPIALGSWWGVLIVVAMMPALIWRLFDEKNSWQSRGICREGALAWPRRRSPRGEINAALKLNPPY
jgi:Phospholipid methyltransferase